MKKSPGVLLAAIAIIIVGGLIVANFSTKSQSFLFDDRNSDIDTVTTTGALFPDAIVTSGFEINAAAEYKNLQVFVLTGSVSLNNKTYTSLQQALDTKMVTVKETSEVNALQIDNHSDAFIYINSGDIVKGGKQDRTIQYDLLIAPHKTNVDIASFCVEHGRWTQRENEDVASFEKSENSLSSKELKIAAKHTKSQQQVWEKVSKYQDKANIELNKSTAPNQRVDVKSGVSESSLQLTLDNDQLKQAKAAYLQQMAGLKNIKNAAGIAYYINGKLYGVDLFNNHRLFADLFDKLLDAAITEAVSLAVLENDKLPSPDLNKLLMAPAMVYEDFDVNEITRFQSSESARFKNMVIFTSFDKSTKKWLHRNWLDKTED